MKNKTYFLHLITLYVLMLFFIIALTISDYYTYTAILAMTLYVEYKISKALFFSSFKRYTILLLITITINCCFGVSYWMGSFYTMFLIALRFSPLFILARCVSSHTSSELMHSFNYMRFPQKIAIAIAVFFRFLPEFFMRLGELRQGAKVRGLNFSIFHPVKSFEIFIVPLMVKAISISDTLTCSIIAKGIEYPCKKTHYRHMPFTHRDGLALVLASILLGCALWIK